MPPAEPEFRSDMTVDLVRASARDADVLFAARVSTKGEASLEDHWADLMPLTHGAFVTAGRVAP